MSATVPALILAPKPAEMVGHKKAMSVAPNPEMLMTIRPTMPRLRNWRLVWP